MDAPLILTLKLDPESTARFEALRRAHFPPGLNLIPAHLTLFHHLPGDRLDAVLDRLATDRPEVMALEATGLRKLGRGLAIAVEGPALSRWRGEIATAFQSELTAQDRQGFRPHVTIQNKVAPAEADALHRSLSPGFAPFAIRGEGATLWRYRGGPWTFEAEVAFRPAGS